MSLLGQNNCHAKQAVPEEMCLKATVEGSDCVEVTCCGRLNQTVYADWL